MLVLKKETKMSSENYDPQSFRDTAVNGISNTAAFIHLLKSALGTGILALPQGFSNAGYILGVLMTCVIGFLCTYCIYMVVDAQYYLCKKSQTSTMTYRNTMKMALEEGPSFLKCLSTSSVYIVDIFLVLHHMGSCSVYILFIAENLKQFVDEYWVEVSLKKHMLIILIPLILLNLIPNLKYLAPVSILSNIIIIIGTVLVVVFILEKFPSVNEREAFVPISRVPLFIGIVLFSMQPIGLVLSIENNMKQPKSFPKVNNSSMVLLILVYCCFGFVGYIKYGNEVEGSVSLNIPKDNIVAQISRLMFAFAILTSFAIQAFVPITIIWFDYISKICVENQNCDIIGAYTTRVLIVIVASIPAFIVTELGLVIALVGALCLSVLGIFFPAVIDLCIKWPDNLGKFKWVLFKNIIIMLIAFVGLISGTYSSLRDIITSASVPEL